MRKKEIAKKIMAALMVLAMLVTNLMIYQPQTVEAAAKNRIVLENKYKTLYVGESYTMKASAFYKDGKLQASKITIQDFLLISISVFLPAITRLQRCQKKVW